MSTFAQLEAHGSNEGLNGNSPLSQRTAAKRRQTKVAVTPPNVAISPQSKLPKLAAALQSHCPQ